MFHNLCGDGYHFYKKKQGRGMHFDAENRNKWHPDMPIIKEMTDYAASDAYAHLMCLNQLREISSPTYSEWYSPLQD
jgi:hypothetical protein